MLFQMLQFLEVSTGKKCLLIVFECKKMINLGSYSYNNVSLDQAGNLKVR